MRNLKEEIQQAKEHFRTLDAGYAEELKRSLAQSSVGQQRRLKDGKAWEALLKKSGIDLTPFGDHDLADAKHAQETLADVQNRLKVVPPSVLSNAQDELNLDAVRNASAAWAFDPPPQKWFSFIPIDRSAMGDCGARPLTDQVLPRAAATGSGTGWSDSHSDTASCGLWFYIPGDYITSSTTALNTLTVWPYVDMHGFYWVRANDGYFTSKEAHIKFTIRTRVYQYSLGNSWWSEWVVRDRSDGNIDEEGRIDFTGYANSAKGFGHVLGREPVHVQVIAEAYCHVEGSGSHALVDFQTGSGNGVRVPRIVVKVP
jgi:hypothetical protein